MAVVVKLVNTPDCGSGMRGFESLQSPHLKYKSNKYLFYRYLLDFFIFCFIIIFALIIIENEELILNDLIKLLRRRRDITQKELANAVGVRQSTISRMENDCSSSS